MKAKNHHVISAALSALLSYQTGAAKQPDVYYLTAAEIKAGNALNLTNALGACGSSFMSHKPGCCEPSTASIPLEERIKQPPADPFLEPAIIEEGNSIDYQGMAFQCVAIEPPTNRNETPSRTGFGEHKFQWISQNVMAFCDSKGLSLTACADHIKVKN
ncbi:hypothetical protein [Marinicella meishanensis]|uniref:hypothetical protein n=1 Tax=Marinicella meishanensis TaxID=2873263 RepID=UPI001CBF0870|nr:hypothetical protein [Marinicella sp. NBU2979]